MHLSENELQSHLDRELSPEQEATIAAHLQECASCRQKLDELERLATANRSRFESTAPRQTDLNETGLLSRMRAGSQHHEHHNKWIRWAAAIAVAAIAVGFYFEPVRVAGAEFLNLFRVRQIAVVRIDPANLERLEQDFFASSEQRKLEQILSANAQVVKRGEVQQVASANDAARVAGFGVRLPASQTPSTIRVHPAVDVSLTIDVEQLQGVLDDAGRSDVRLPEDLDGQMIRINIPASVTTFIGKCPDLEKPDDDEDTSRHDYPECKIVVQLPAPSVIAPPSLNVEVLATEILKLLGLSEEQARQFSASIDWSSTLVVPLPIDPRMKFSQVQVDSVQGNLFVTKRHGLEGYNLLWIRDGILYSVVGQGNSDEALAIANTM